MHITGKIQKIWAFFLALIMLAAALALSVSAEDTRFDGKSWEEITEDFLAERGYDEKYGARPLRRAIRSMIEDKAAELMLTDSLGRGDTVQASIDGNELILTKHGV